MRMYEFFFNFRRGGFEYLAQTLEVISVQPAPDNELPVSDAAVNLKRLIGQTADNRQKVFAYILLGFCEKTVDIFLGCVENDTI